MNTNQSIVYSKAEKYGMAKLFKVVPMTMFVRSGDMVSLYQCVRRGFIVATEGGTVVEVIPKTVYNLLDQLYGTDALALNNTLHRSFADLATMSAEQYYTQQLLHYFSTYGHEALGFAANPWVPMDQQRLPMFRLNVDKLVVIHVADGGMIVDLINKYALSTVAPSSEIISAFRPLMHRITIPTDDIKSFELQVIKHDMDETVPSTPIGILRYLVYKTTGETVLIKNSALIAKIKDGIQGGKEAACAQVILGRANKTELASIFLRYKPIFLAYKVYPGCAPIINKLRRMADTYHRPASDINIRNFTKLAFAGRQEDCAAVIEAASNRELVKLANHLGARIATGGNGVQPGVFNVRNGRTFVKAEAFDDDQVKLVNIYNWLTLICDVLSVRLSQTLRDKVFVLPDYIDYAAPVSEKQFTGNIPWGTRITAALNGAYTTGVHWFDHKVRTDIDLHLNSATEHYGWNGGHRDGANLIYTGDQTAAPKPLGAAEAYWFDASNGTFILSANLFSGSDDGCPFKLFMSLQKPSDVSVVNRKYVFNENEAVFPPIPMKFEKGQNSMTLGLFAEGSFYFYGGAITDGIVPSTHYENFIKGLVGKVQNQWLISELLNQAGAIVVPDLNTDELTDEQKANAIDLSPAALTATTLLEIVDGTIK